MKIITAYVKNKDTCIIIHLIHLQFSCILNFCTLGVWSWSFLDYFETFNKKKTFVYRYRKKYVEFFFPKK